jgi:hypothetical protein
MSSQICVMLSESKSGKLDPFADGFHSNRFSTLIKDPTIARTSNVSTSSMDTIAILFPKNYVFKMAYSSFVKHIREISKKKKKKLVIFERDRVLFYHFSENTF